MSNAKLDQNSRPTLTALSNIGDGSIVTLYADPTTHRLLVDVVGGGTTTVDVGTTTTLTPGSSATVVNAGTSTNAVFNFGIPAGVQGIQGNPGTAATIAVGTTTTLVAGSPATVANVGTSAAAIFNFGIPKGADGTGNVVGPASAVDSDIAVFDTTTGKLLKDGGKKIADLELVANKATDFSTINNTLYPTVQAVNTAIATAVVGLLDYRGSYDASTNLYPATGGSGLAGAILKGDFWIITVVGTLGGTLVAVGDLVIALVDTPAQTAANWNIVEYALGYTPENVANKVTSISGSSTDVQYPSAKLLYDQLAGKQASASSLTTLAGLTATTGNIIQSVGSAWASQTPTQVTATLIGMTGDAGAGGLKGLVPAQAIGDATKVLSGAGTWVTNGTGTVTTVSVATANGFSGTVANATTTPAITIIAGAITPSTVNGILVGQGTNAILGNTGVGYETLDAANSGTGYNTALGFRALTNNTSGQENVAVGFQSSITNISGSKNTSVGINSLFSNSSGSGNVALGYYAGTYETGSGAFYVDNQDRTNTAGDKAGALLYGTFNATPASQTLKVNGTLSATAFGTINGNTITTGTGTLTLSTFTLTVAGTASVSGTNTGDNATNSTYTTLATTIATANTWSATQSFNRILDVNNAISAVGNAATVPITYSLNTVTNNSAATLTITMTTTSAVDGMMTIVRILDATNVAQTITWVNTENSGVSVPTTSNGSTTLFLTTGFIYNGGTSKWRCIASA